MDNPILITAPEQLCPFDAWHLALHPDEFAQDGPDAHWILLERSGNPVARCSLWWHHTPSHLDHRVGFIGHFASASAEASSLLLSHSIRELARRSVTLAVGPVNGSTWRQYRFVTEPGIRPTFFFEPTNPPAWPLHWQAAGFKPIADYHSRLVSDLSLEDLRGRSAQDRLHRLGVRVRSLRLAEFEPELLRLHALISKAFQGHLLYSPLSCSSFVQQHSRLRPLLKPELISIAEHEGRIVGLLFSVPDIAQSARGEAIDTTIIKTLAISPERPYAGLGSYLTRLNHEISRDLGYTHVIHALMHQANKSQSISSRYGQVMRRYSLFAKDL